MPKYSVHLQVALNVFHGADSPTQAAFEVRTRVLGMLSELPRDIHAVSIGPDFTWQVREVFDNNRHSAILSFGTDYDHDPR